MIHLTREICNPEKKRDITAFEVMENINKHFGCEVATMAKENNILIDSSKLTESTSKIRITI